MRARVPGIDVRNTPALLRERQETSHPPKTLPSKAIPPGPLGSGRTACCLEEERFARMQYKPRIYNFVRLSGCVPSKTLDTPPTHDRPLECTTSNPLPFAERGHLRDLPALAFSLHHPFEAFCWTVPTLPHSSSQNDIFNCALTKWRHAHTFAFALMHAIIASGHMCILQTNGPRRQSRLSVWSL